MSRPMTPAMGSSSMAGSSMSSDRGPLPHGGSVIVVGQLGDYRHVAGVMLPFVLELRPKGQPQGMKITFHKVEANLPMELARFKMPHGTVPASR